MSRNALQSYSRSKSIPGFLPFFQAIGKKNGMKNVLQERPRYTKNQSDTLLFQELKKLVDARISTLPKSRFLPIKIKAVALPLLYLFFYVLAISIRVALLEKSA